MVIQKSILSQRELELIYCPLADLIAFELLSLFTLSRYGRVLMKI